MTTNDDTPQTASDPLALTLDEYPSIMDEIEEQPKWRHTADKEMDLPGVGRHAGNDEAALGIGRLP